MQIHSKIQAIDLGLYLEEHKTIVLSDFHLGYEEAMMKKGVLVPRLQYKDIIDRIEQILAKVQPDTIVLNGDLKHEFGPASKQEWQDVMRLIDHLSRKCKEIIIVKGNHDVILGPIAR